MSPDEKLSHMANQIGRFFQSQKADTAAAAIADHLLKFWDPRMRHAIQTQLANGTADLDPLVQDAVRRLGEPPGP